VLGLSGLDSKITIMHMHKVILAPEVRAYIRRYIDAYILYYENLYSDSGLGIAEEIIIDQYRQSARAISDMIYTGIEDTMTRATILGQHTAWDMRIVTTRIENRRLFITYSESDTERIVNRIEIVRL
jgi:hypothetical protein